MRMSKTSLETESQSLIIGTCNSFQVRHCTLLVRPKDEPKHGTEPERRSESKQGINIFSIEIVFLRLFEVGHGVPEIGIL